MARSANRRDSAAIVPTPERASDAAIARCRAEVEGGAKRIARRALLPVLAIRKRLAEVGEGFQWDLRAGFVVGTGSRLGRYAYLGYGFEANGPIALGDLVMVAAGCKIVGSDHLFDRVGDPIRLAFADRPRGVTVFGVDAWIGQNVTILEGLTIGRGAVVAAASVIVKDVPPYSIVAGVPAKVLRSRFDAVQIAEHERAVCAESLSAKEAV